MSDPGPDGSPIGPLRQGGPSYASMGCGCLLAVAGGLAILAGVVLMITLAVKGAQFNILALSIVVLIGAPPIALGLYMMVTPWRLWNDASPAPLVSKDDGSSGS